MVPNWNAPSSWGSRSASDGSIGSMHFSSSGVGVGVVTTATGGASDMNGDNKRNAKLDKKYLPRVPEKA